MRPLYEWLGLTASLGFVDIPDYEYAENEKQMLYNHDIIYTTNGRLGFDYLFDNLADHINAKYLPELNFAIIDEVDSIILDRANTTGYFWCSTCNPIYSILLRCLLKR